MLAKQQLSSFAAFPIHSSVMTLILYQYTSMSYTGKVGLTFLYFVHSELMELKIYTISVWLYRMLHQALLLL